MKKILIVDDDPDIVEVTKLILEIEDYHVLGLDNPNNVIDNVRSYRPDLLILEVMLGDIDGREICHHLKTSSDTRHIPILMFSAVHDFKSIRDNRCEADDFISKPYDMVTMLEKVRQLTTA
ncbi:MAG: response regulator [Pedobacter sp.]|nr:MAG: response regulator [Pedobacter sp.]